MWLQLIVLYHILEKKRKSKTEQAYTCPKPQKSFVLGEKKKSKKKSRVNTMVSSISVQFHSFFPVYLKLSSRLLSQLLLSAIFYLIHSTNIGWARIIHNCSRYKKENGSKQTRYVPTLNLPSSEGKTTLR